MSMPGYFLNEKLFFKGNCCSEHKVWPMCHLTNMHTVTFHSAPPEKGPHQANGQHIYSDLTSPGPWTAFIQVTTSQPIETSGPKTGSIQSF